MFRTDVTLKRHDRFISTDAEVLTVDPMCTRRGRYSTDSSTIPSLPISFSKLKNPSHVKLDARSLFGKSQCVVIQRQSLQANKTPCLWCNGKTQVHFRSGSIVNPGRTGCSIINHMTMKTITNHFVNVTITGTFAVFI